MDKRGVGNSFFWFQMPLINIFVGRISFLAFSSYGTLKRELCPQKRLHNLQTQHIIEFKIGHFWWLIGEIEEINRNVIYIKDCENCGNYRKDIGFQFFVFYVVSLPVFPLQLGQILLNF